jgi:enoyl-CoA hydratase/3-hydroxyacyl-CoA dehydrogenase
MSIIEIKKVCFVGAGTMGCYNSLITALAGYQVALYDISQQTLDMVPERQLNWSPTLMELGVANRKAIEAASAAITRTMDPKEAAQDVDLLSESVYERLDLKRQVHKQFDTVLPPHAIMTTNTSTLLLSDIESAVKRGDKFAAMHFHQTTPLVDIVAGPRTSPETMDIVKRFVKSQGQISVVLKKEREGYLHNAMFSGLLATAQMLAVLLNVDFKKIDQTWMLSQNDLFGPFGLIDGVGLDLVLDILEENAKKEEDANPEIRDAVRDFLLPYIEREDLGIKTGKGFYEYPDPEFQNPEFLCDVKEDKMLSGPMVSTVLSTALTLVAEGFADLQDVDKSWMLTHNPECGPFGTMDIIGLDVVKKELQERAAQIEAMMRNPGKVTETTKIATDFLDSYIQNGELGVKTGKGFYSYPDPEYQKPGFLA